MLTSNLKKLLLFAFMIALTTMNLSAQGMPPRAMERIQSLKKVKLLEVLDLNEAEADKFIVKFNELEKNVTEKFKALDKATDELRKAVQDEDYKNIDKLNADYLKANEELTKAVQFKFESMSKILSKENFAKYVLFERRFQEEVRKQIMEKRQDKDRPRKFRN